MLHSGNSASDVFLYVPDVGDADSLYNNIHGVFKNVASQSALEFASVMGGDVIKQAEKSSHDALASMGRTAKKAGFATIGDDETENGISRRLDSVSKNMFRPIGKGRSASMLIQADYFKGKATNLLTTPGILAGTPSQQRGGGRGALKRSILGNDERVLVDIGAGLSEKIFKRQRLEQPTSGSIETGIFPALTEYGIGDFMEVSVVPENPEDKTYTQVALVQGDQVNAATNVGILPEANYRASDDRFIKGVVKNGTATLAPGVVPPAGSGSQSAGGGGGGHGPNMDPGGFRSGGRAFGFGEREAPTPGPTSAVPPLQPIQGPRFRQAPTIVRMAAGVFRDVQQRFRAAGDTPPLELQHEYQTKLDAYAQALRSQGLSPSDIDTFDNLPQLPIAPRQAPPQPPQGLPEAPTSVRMAAGVFRDVQERLRDATDVRPGEPGGLTQALQNEYQRKLDAYSRALQAAGIDPENALDFEGLPDLPLAPRTPPTGRPTRPFRPPPTGRPPASSDPPRSNNEPPAPVPAPSAAPQDPDEFEPRGEPTIVDRGDAITKGQFDQEVSTLISQMRALQATERAGGGTDSMRTEYERWSDRLQRISVLATEAGWRVAASEIISSLPTSIRPEFGPTSVRLDANLSDEKLLELLAQTKADMFEATSRGLENIPAQFTMAQWRGMYERLHAYMIQADWMARNRGLHVPPTQSPLSPNDFFEEEGEVEFP